MSTETTIPTDEKNVEFQQESFQPSNEESVVAVGGVEKDEDVGKETEIFSSVPVEDNSSEPVVAEENPRLQSSLEVGAATDLDKQDSQKSLVPGNDQSTESQKEGSTSVKGGEEFQIGVSASSINVAATDTESKSEGASRDIEETLSDENAHIADSSRLIVGFNRTRRRNSQESTNGSSSGGDSLETVIGGCRSSAESGAAGDISSSLDSHEGPSPPNSKIGDLRKVAVLFSSNTGDSQEGAGTLSCNMGDIQDGAIPRSSTARNYEKGAIPPSSDTRDSEKGAIPRSSTARDSEKGAIPRSSTARDYEKGTIPRSFTARNYEKGAIPRSSDARDSEKGAIPRSSTARDYEKGTIPRSSTARDYEKGAIPRSSTARDYEKGAIPRSFTARDYEKGAIPRSSTARDYEKGAIPRSSTARDYEKEAIPRSSKTRDSQVGAVPSSSNTKDSQETAAADDLGGVLQESGAVGDISSSTTPPCPFISSLPPIPPGRLPWDYDSGDTPPPDATVPSSYFSWDGNSRAPAAGNTRRYDSCFSRCCNVCDYLRPYCRSIRKSTTFKFIRIALLFMATAYFILGLSYWDSCPVQSKLGVLVMVSGIVGILLLISSLLIGERTHICPNVWKEVLTLGMIVGRIIFLAIFGAVLNATYSISPSFDQESEIYCDETFYHFTYYANFVVCAIVILAFLIYVPGINDVDYERL